MRIHRVVAFALIGLVSASLMAGMPGASFAYQGVLKNSSQQPLTGNQTVTICLYGTATGSDVLWGRQFNVLLDSNGLFNLEVADGDNNVAGAKYTQLSKALRDAATTSFYLGLTVQGSAGEIRPRQQLLCVPFATVAGDVANASGDMKVENILSAGTVKTGAMSVSGKVEFQNQLVVNGTAQVGSKLTVASGGAKISGSIELDGATTVNSALTVKGATTVNDKITANKEVTVNNDLVLTGNIYKKVGNAKHQINFIKGMIMLWSGSTANIPAGWKLCDGNDGRPDLRDRFVVGAGKSYAVGNSGGSDKVKLTENEIPSHVHGYISDDSLYNNGFAARLGSNTYDFDFTSKNSGSGKLYQTTSKGGDGSHENRPPYYALCYIMYMGQ